MNPLSIYIPMDRRHALATKTSLPHRTTGVALFADISGFTLLTATLAEELGPQRGAEELTYYINRVYSALIQQVHNYHGSVIGFSGDAITCWFDQAEADTAVTCAFQMQEAITQLDTIQTPSGAIIAFGIKVALAAGPARRFLVGHKSHRAIEVLAGATLDRMALAEQQARQGEVVVSEEIITNGRFHIHIWRQDANGRFAVIDHIAQPAPTQPWLPFHPLTDETSASWLLPPVYQRLQQGLGEFLTELRPAVALFLKFGGLDYEQDDASSQLDAFIHWVQTILTQYDGYLLQLSMGDKGSYLYAAFGAPIAHEDNAARAVSAALALQSPPTELNHIQPIQIGISQGQMRVGAYGSQTRRTYGVLGQETNMAARLMSHAQPGQILVTKHILQATDQRFTFQSLGNIDVKGHNTPIPIYSVQSQRYAATMSTLKGRSLAPMVGRQEERHYLRQALQALKTGQTSHHHIIIEGEAGIGKSRLVADLRQQAQTQQTPTFISQGNAIRQTTPYHAWRSTLLQLFNLDTPITSDHHMWPEHIQQHLKNVAPHLLQLAPLLNAILPLDLPDNELTIQMVGDVRAYNLHELVSQLLATEPEPCLFILEDTHWFDSASWALARVISQGIRPHLLVMATRPLAEPQPPTDTYFYNLPQTHHIHLERLTPSQIETLVVSRLNVSHLPQSILQLIQDKAEGHPFYSEELVYALRDAGHIEISNGRCHVVGNLETLNFPDTIQGVITSRIDLLPSLTPINTQNSQCHWSRLYLPPAQRHSPYS